MIGFVSTRQPIRGIMAKEIHEHMVKMASKDSQSMQRVYPRCETNYRLVETQND